ncbi:YggS family pyridoxal phosphate-dependent enzyme [Luteitalea sp.]|uniref:YggS family pyridoxal phosphate-dependent enzyme n=1 Tax=Luteitalea sp. TaxID=2004800 RepID=UPI000B0F51E4|nr:YggS family pyridoxal phosphate-dependent enzyme [Luteitalea sp.]
MSTDALDSGLPGRLAAIRARIASAAIRSGRSPEAVRLIAVSKTFGADAVRAAHAEGQLDFGENRVQEALAKQAETADLPLRWHLIGPLQSNKANKVPGAFAGLQSVHSLDLLARLSKAAVSAGVDLPVLIQVDLAHEATKSGLDEAELRHVLASARDLPGVRVEGLMLLPPYAEDPEQVRPWFRRLRDLRDTLLAEGVPPDQLRELSMGMSHDFEVAIEEGATIVRVGSALFGTRL